MHFEAEAKASGPCSRSIFVVRFGILMACDNLDIASFFQVQFSSAWKRRDSQDILSESQKFSRWVEPKPPLWVMHVACSLFLGYRFRMCTAHCAEHYPTIIPAIAATVLAEWSNLSCFHSKHLGTFFLTQDGDAQSRAGDKTFLIRSSCSPSYF